MIPTTGLPRRDTREHLAPESGASAWLTALALALLVAVLNFALWQGLHKPQPAPDYEGPIAGLAYNAFGRWDSPLERKFPTAEQVEADLALLSTMTKRVRTYSSSELPELPAIAERHDLRLTAGVWLDERAASNRRELEAIKVAVRSSDSIERVIAGNETLLLGRLTPEQLYDYLDELRAALRVPVSTAEPWHVWLRYPKLARHVDYITVHLLPYHEGVPSEAAIGYAFERLEQLRRAFPGKHIVIGEIGWPSQGDRIDAAYATPLDQAKFIRSFLAQTQGEPLDYFLMEAVDQPWKQLTEGRTGPYWGILHADRSAKFAMEGPVQPDANWVGKAAAASLLALVPMLWFAAAMRRMRLASRVAFCVLLQGAASLLVWLVMLPLDYYLRPLDWALLAVLLPALMAMTAILLANGFEFVEMFWRGNLRREFGPRPLADGAREPFVSIHLACCNEPPEMVIATIDSLAALDYRNFEVLVIDNNTSDPAKWQPVERHCAQLGERFRFFHLPKWPGFKAGALNFALEQTDPRAEVVGVVDADYVVKRSWLRDLAGWFDDAKVAVVQSPQSHRDWASHPFKRMMNWEYEGFFRIGMHHRNERDAIIQHGTMTLIRAEALRDHGRWSEWCICEDAELGLRLMKRGLATVYVDRVMGEGLVPDDFAAFRRQRRRWAFGAMQILKGHWGDLVRPGALTGAQRYHFLTGWLSWFGDALHLVFALAAMVWTLGIVAFPEYFSVPIALFMVPLVIFFACKAMFGPLLYLRRVPCSLRDVLGAALAGMGLSHAIALGVFSGLSQRRGVFEVTNKGAKKRAAAVFAVREEAFLLAGLAVCMGAMWMVRRPGHPESLLWIGVLALQAVPYLAALACEALSRWPQGAERSSVEPIASTAARGAVSAGASSPVTLPVPPLLPGLAGARVQPAPAMAIAVRDARGVIGQASAVAAAGMAAAAAAREAMPRAAGGGRDFDGGAMAG